VKGGPRRVELRIWSSETRTLTVVPQPEGGGGPSRFPGDLRRGPVHPARRDLESRVVSEPKLTRDLRRDRMWRRLRVSTEVVARLALSSIRSQGAGLSGCATVSRQRQARVGALRGDPRGAKRFSAGEASWCLGVTCRSRAGSRLVHGRSLPKQAEPGRSERAGAFDKSKLRQLWFQRRASRRSARLKARTRRGQAALPIVTGAWEARRATGYV
jgi:hypothetical protein